MPEPSLEFMDVVRAFAASPCVLAVYKFSAEATRADARNERTLDESIERRLNQQHRVYMHEKTAHFGSDRFCVFRIPLSGTVKFDHGNVVFVQQQTEHDERTHHARCIDFRWSVFQIQGNAHSRLQSSFIFMARVKQTKK